MANSASNDDLNLHFSQIEAARDHFATSLRRGGCPLESYLEASSQELGDSLFVELLSAEIEYELAHGRRPSFRAIRRRFPQQESLVRQTFEALGLFELSSLTPTDATSIPTDAVGSEQSSMQLQRDWMPGDVKELVSSLVELGLMRPEQLCAALDELNVPSRTRAGLIEHLAARGLVTAFQASSLQAGRANKLATGQYLLVNKIGQGGMGNVYLARHRKMNRMVALKVLRPDAFRNPELLRRFQREIEIISKFHHPHIVQAYDAGEVGGQHFLAMEYVPGTDLQRLVVQGGLIPWPQAVDYLLQAAEGLAHAHEAGVIHRDVKPSNLLLSDEGVIKVLDLGLACEESRHRDSITGSGQVLGTTRYMAPEQAAAIKSADERSDIYSLGCTLYYLLTGEAPYQANSPVATLFAHAEWPVPSLQERSPEVPDRLERIYRCMLAKEPADRYSTLRKLIADLRSDLRKPLRKERSRPSMSAGVRTWGLVGVGGASLIGVLLGDSLRTQTTNSSELPQPANVQAESRPTPTQLVEDRQPTPKQRLLPAMARNIDAAVSLVFERRGSLQFDTPSGITADVYSSEQRPPGITPVRSINLAGSREFVDADLRVIGRLLDLQQLDVSGTSVTNRGLSHLVRLRQLHTLSLDNTRVDDTGLDQLANLTALRVLRISGSRATPASVERLKQHIPGLVVDLSSDAN